MPIPPGTIPDTPDELQPDVAYGAQQYTANRKAGKDIPPNSPLAQSTDTRGFWHSLANATPMPMGGGIPVTPDEAKQALLHIAMPWLGPLKQAYGLVKDHSFQNFNRQLNPMAAPMEQMGSGNVAGGMGSMTPFLATSLAAPFIPKGPAVVQPGSAPAINLASPRPSSYNPAVAVYGPSEAPASLPARALEFGVRDIAGKLPGGTALADSLKGKIAKPKAGLEITGYQPRQRVSTLAESSKPIPAPPVTFSGRLGRPLPPPQQPLGSPPLRPVGDWYRPVPEAAYGDAPTQPLIQPTPVPSEYNLPRVAQKRTEVPREVGPSGAIRSGKGQTAIPKAAMNSVYENVSKAVEIMKKAGINTDTLMQLLQSMNPPE